jgi:hypothetical protein
MLCQAELENLKKGGIKITTEVSEVKRVNHII